MCNLDLCVLPSAAFSGEAWAFLPTSHDMGYTTTPLGHASSGLGIGFKSSSAIGRTVHESPPAGPYKSPTPDISRVPHRRLRQTKSYTLPRKKFKTATDSFSRSCSVTNDFSAEKSSAMSLSSGDSQKRDRKPVRFFVYRCMRGKVHLTQRSSRRRLLQTNS